MILVPALFFGLLELSLRLLGYGCPTGFFEKLPGRDAYCANQRFGWRFFPPSVSRTPERFVLPAEKPARTYRIFVLGGSAAAGTPSPAFGFGRILQVMLEDRFPGVKFEVVIAAMTAVNSHVVRIIAADCAAHGPDLFIVYMGNNEILGPYGPGTVFAGFSPSLSVIRASIFVKGLRTGQLLGNVIGWFGPAGPTGGWKGLEMFTESPVPAGDPRLQDAYEHFEANLSDICDLAHDAGAQTVLCTVATNLRTCPPFASVHRAGLAVADKKDFQRLCDAGAALQQRGDYAGGVARYQQAARIDDGFAELHFRLGQCFWAMGRFADARKHFTLARDLDALRFRADSRMDEIIRTVAKSKAGRNVHLVDAASAVEQSPLSPNGLPGEELFYEHVHLTFEGNHAVAQTVFGKVAGIVRQSLGARGGGKPPSAARCAELLALTAWDRYRMAETIYRMTRRPPFTCQLDHARRAAWRRQRADELRRGLTPTAFQAAEDLYRRAVQRHPEDLWFRVELADLLSKRGDFEGAVEQWRFVRRRLPRDAAAAVSLGCALMGLRKTAEAVEQFNQSLDVWPERAIARSNLGAALAAQGRTAEAIEQIRQAIALEDELAEAHYNLGKILATTGRLAEAVGPLRRAVELEADHLKARYALGNVYVHLNRRREALEEYRRLVAIAPNEARARLNLGTLLLADGQAAEGSAHLLEAARLAPDNYNVQFNIAEALLSQDRAKQAVPYYRRAVDLLPQSAPAIHNLGMALYRAGDVPEALARLAEAVRLAPDFPKHLNLAGLMVAHGRAAEGEDHCRAALHLRPRHPRAIAVLADALDRQGKLAEAAATYRRLLPQRPDDPELLLRLAFILASAPDAELRDSDQACTLATRACESSHYKSPRPLDALGAALAAAGRFDEAVTAAQKALHLAEAAGKSPLANEIKGRIALYTAGKPFRRGVAAGSAPATGPKP